MPCEPQGEDKSFKLYKNLKSDELLSYEEMHRIVKVAVSLGMGKLRLTGGEPLIRRGILDFIEKISDLEGLEQIRLTTNGVLLKENAKKLFSMGVRYLNISLDTLTPSKFVTITGKDHFKNVIEGIDEAIKTGFKIKLNVVAMKGVNDDEFIDFAALAIRKNIQVRFIEFMPIGKGSNWHKNQYIASEDILKMLSLKYGFEQMKGSRADGPARMYTVRNEAGDTGKLGFISPISHHFCDKCNRLRLTSEGKLRACLLHDGDTDLKAILRQGCDDRDIEEAIRNTILFKPKNHGLNEDGKNELKPACHSQMSRIGG